MDKTTLQNAIGKYYFVDKTGSVLNLRTKNYISPSIDHKGYLRARIFCPELSKNKDKRINFRIHRLVALFYLDNFSDKLQVNHKNGIKTDNLISNLEMVTNSQNKKHFWDNLDTSKVRKSLENRRMTNGRFGVSIHNRSDKSVQRVKDFAAQLTMF
jgi:predicted HAD superfamily hydrolase